MDEKRQLLNFVFQNLKLDGKNLSIQTCEPFTTLVDYKKRPKEWGKLYLNQRPAGYEGGRLSYYPLPSNRYEQDDKGFMAKMLLDFIGFQWCNT